MNNKDMKAKKQKWTIRRIQKDSLGKIIDQQSLVGIDCDGIPNWVSTNNRMCFPKFFTNEKWLEANLQQCKRYFEERPTKGVNFSIEAALADLEKRNG